jgi:hypothetical protein
MVSIDYSFDPSYLDVIASYTPAYKGGHPSTCRIKLDLPPHFTFPLSPVLFSSFRSFLTLLAILVTQHLHLTS